MTQRWWQRPFAMFQTNLREIDAGMDVEAALDAITAYGADVWLINAGGILSFYPSDLPFQTRNPALSERASGDLLGDAVEAAHRRGVRLMARMDFSKISKAIADDHPEWCFIGPDGERQVYNDLVSTCPSADYYQQRSFEIIDEVLDRYPVDGFFFNWFGFNEVDYSGVYRGPCANDTSRKSFAEFSGGAELPTGPDSPTYDQWRSWSRGVLKDLSERIHDHVKQRNPDAGLILRDAADIVFHEANNKVGRELWHPATGAMVSGVRSESPELPVLVNAVSFIDMPYRMAAERTEHFAQYFAQTLARGGNPSAYIMGPPGEIDYPLLGQASEIVRLRKANSDSYADLRPAGSIGLVRPDPLAQTLTRHAESEAEFRGLYAALQEGHCPFDVIPAEGLAQAPDLDRLAVLIIPDCPLASDAASAVERFRSAGGRLLITGRGTIDADGRPQLSGMPIRRVLQTRDDPEELKATYVSADADAPDFAPPMLPVYGSYHEVESAADARSMLAHLGAARFGPPEKAYGNQPDGRPGYLVSGDGAVALVPWTIGRCYYDLGLDGFRRLAAGLVRSLAGAGVLLTAELDECVEITMQRAPGRLVLHLINFSGRRRKSFAPPIPVSGRVRLPLSAAPRGVRALVAGRSCPSSYVDGELIIELPDIELFEAIVIEEK
ncbi:alpha-amylase family protein [Microlunatus soli]|uniref:Hypothetical glycosyl hydrolase 6 n=1 Tax=Microlunatus soli TaxID=630515 RepID=A0A1H1XTE4_9ACTN|nr:alpha-amylase family protein [Microlunatus soli]SDT12480.1 Hypothetical glycosyl hydrolase 6 [Microlunatus soli]